MLKLRLEQQEKNLKFLQDLVVIQKRALNEGMLKSLENKKSIESLIAENQKLHSKLNSKKLTSKKRNL
jgi:septal ring factor EnvC (AmiA/AmiB activator)